MCARSETPPFAGADALRYPRVVCAVYFPGSEWCGGGVAALNGLTGEEMWRIYVAHELFALTCHADLDGDGIWDCVAGGRMAVSPAHDGGLSVTCFVPFPA